MSFKKDFIRGGMKESSGGGEFKYDVFDTS
jgi:hypothetical protein